MVFGTETKRSKQAKEAEEIARQNDQGLVLSELFLLGRAKRKKANNYACIYICICIFRCFRAGKDSVSSIPREKILQSCALTSMAVGLFGVGLNFGSKLLHQPDLPFAELDLPDFGLSVAATVFVTLCRVGMVNFNEEYRISFDLSNRTVGGQMITFFLL